VTLVCFAVTAEARPFQRRARNLSGVRVLVTGIGRRNAERAVSAWLAKEQPARVLTCGFAGGLDAALLAGQVVFDADQESGLRGALLATGARQVSFHCADRVVVTPEEKRALRASSAAGAVEMESGAIRALCRSRGVPGATVRVISDTAGEALPVDFNRLLTPGFRFRCGRFAGALACRPGAIVRLWRWRCQLRLAARALADALVRVIPT
jgi:nucleoside phosphorylase